ncbi:DUF2530 domain-containing protein [Jiangella ureilytica]|uniref:DUF2530 domain-containing protein n=2 Tax=Jiangella ureilytica TaxID=2530374 RepID=A0A4R4RQ40_9ACTN|nr:DUF2530 domain-containing protein [Jiangella ureilytica]
MPGSLMMPSGRLGGGRTQPGFAVRMPEDRPRTKTAGCGSARRDVSRRASLGFMAKRRRRSPGEPEVEAVEPHEVQPLDVDGVRTVAVVTVLWAVAFVLLALRMDSLQAEGRGWWVWTCLAGVGLGLLGLEYTRKRRDAIEFEREEAELAAAEAAGAADGPAGEVLTRGEVIARDTDVAARPQSAPDSVTRPIDTGDDLPPVRPETTRTDTTRVDGTRIDGTRIDGTRVDGARVDPPPTRPGSDPRGARPDTTTHGRPSWSGDREQAGGLPGGPAQVPGAAERPVAPSRTGAGERPAATPQRPAADLPPRSGPGDRPAPPAERPAAVQRPGAGESPAGPQRPGVGSPRPGAGSRTDAGAGPAGAQRPGAGSPRPGAAPERPAAAPRPRADETPAAPHRPAAAQRPGPAESPAAPSQRPTAPDPRPAAGDRPAAPSQRPATPERPAAAPRPRSGETPAAPRPAATPPPQAERPARRATPPASELFGEPLSRPAAPLDDDEPLLDTTFGGRRPAPAEEPPAASDADDTTEGGSQYRGRRARRSDTA